MSTRPSNVGLTKEAELFTEAAGRFGLKRLSDDTFSPELFGSVLNEIRARTNRRIEAFRTGTFAIREMPQVIFDFTDERTLNACAFVHDGRPFIALTGFGVAAIYSAMFRLLSSPHALEEIGCCTNESEGVPDVPISADFGLIASRLLSTGVTLESYSPKDRTRDLTARVMAQIATDFVITHEFRHHQAGHVGFWRKVTGKPFVHEFNTTVNDLCLVTRICG